MKSYDIVESITDEATRQMPDLREIPDRKEFLKNLCEDLDVLMDLTEAETFSAGIDERNMDILLTLSCPEILAREENHPLSQILVNVKSFAVKKSPDMEDGIELQFRLPGIWASR